MAMLPTQSTCTSRENAPLVTSLRRILQKYLRQHRCPLITDEQEGKELYDVLDDHVSVVAGFCSDIITNARGSKRVVSDEDIIGSECVLLEYQIRHLQKYDHSQIDSCGCVFWLRDQLMTSLLMKLSCFDCSDEEFEREMTILPNRDFWINVLREERALDNVDDHIKDVVRLQMAIDISMRNQMTNCLPFVKVNIPMTWLGGQLFHRGCKKTTKQRSSFQLRRPDQLQAPDDIKRQDEITDQHEQDDIEIQGEPDVYAYLESRWEIYEGTVMNRECRRVSWGDYRAHLRGLVAASAAHWQHRSNRDRALIYRHLERTNSLHLLRGVYPDEKSRSEQPIAKPAHASQSKPIAKPAHASQSKPIAKPISKPARVNRRPRYDSSDDDQAGDEQTASASPFRSRATKPRGNRHKNNTSAKPYKSAQQAEVQAEQQTRQILAMQRELCILELNLEQAKQQQSKLNKDLANKKK